MSIAIPMTTPEAPVAESEGILSIVNNDAIHVGTEIETEVEANHTQETQYPLWAENIIKSSIKFPIIIKGGILNVITEVITVDAISFNRGKIKEIVISSNKPNSEPKQYTFELKK